MKQGKHFFYMAAMLLATLTGCQEIEGTDITGNAAVNDEVELVASMEDAASRTLLSEDNQVTWVKNDKLAIFYGYDSPSEFTLKKGEGTTQGTFRTPNVSTAGKSIGDAVVAVYPYNKNAKLTCNEDGTYSVKTRFPAEQHYSSNSFGSGASPMMAISVKGEDLSFKNVGATIKMRVKSQVEGAVITKIVAYTTERDGQRRQLAGEAIYTMKAGGNPTVELVDNENAVSEIVLICDDGVELSTTDVTEFYFTLPPMVGENEFEANELVFELFESDRVSCTIFKEVAFGCDRSVITTIGEEEGYTYVPVEKEVDEAPYVTFASENVQTLSTVAYDYSTSWWNPTKNNVPVEGLEYSVGEGDWQALGDGEAEFGGANGDLRLRGKCANGTGNTDEFVMISLSGSDVTCSGDIRTLIDYENYETTSTANARFYGLFQECTALTDASALQLISNNNEMAEACYSSMFAGCASLVSAPALPATTLAVDCYSSMFSDCTSMANAPELPATTLADGCYSYMFNGCTSLADAPELPATTLADYCYDYMFSGCASLVSAPALPATTLAVDCYSSMFSGCASLADAPELPATTLADGCYSYMFDGCTSLAKAPELPATTLAVGCYSYMFKDCTKLTASPILPALVLTEECYTEMFEYCTNMSTITMLATDITADNCLNYWVYMVASRGTFYRNSNATGLKVDSSSGIPSGWTVKDAPPTVGLNDFGYGGSLTGN